MQTEQPVRIGPGLDRNPTARAGEQTKLVHRVFALPRRCDALAFAEGKGAAGNLHLCSARLTRYISMRPASAFHTASCAKRVRSKSAPISRLMRASRLRLNAAVMPARIVIGEHQILLALLEIDTDNHPPPVPEQTRSLPSNARASVGVRLPIVEPEKKPSRASARASARGVRGSW